MLVGQGGFAVIQGEYSGVGDGGTHSILVLYSPYPKGWGQTPTSRCRRGCGTPSGSPLRHAGLPARPQLCHAGGRGVRCPPRRSTVSSPRHERDRGTPPPGSPAPRTACRGAGWARSPSRPHQIPSRPHWDSPGAHFPQASIQVPQGIEEEPPGVGARPVAGGVEDEEGMKAAAIGGCCQ